MHDGDLRVGRAGAQARSRRDPLLPVPAPADDLPDANVRLVRLPRLLSSHWPQAVRCVAPYMHRALKSVEQVGAGSGPACAAKASSVIDPVR